MKRSTAYTAVLLILVLIIAALGFLIVRRKGPAAPAPTEPPVNTAVQPPRGTDKLPEAPEDTTPPEPTEPPVFETRPPVETEEPAPSPTPTPRPEAQGSCSSSTGVGLNIRADWYTLPGGDKLQVDVYCVSYSVFTSAQWQGVRMSLGGESYTADSKAVSYDGKDQVTNLLASFTVDTPPAGTPISVTWTYKGSYSGKDLPEITASGAVTY